MSSSHERDQSIERLLRQSLKAPRQAGATDACLDAETLAAWVDGGLSGAALEMAQSHVADCDRCQALVGAMARADVAIPQPEPARTTRWWLAWLVPLTAATAAVALWVAVPREANVNLAAPPAASAPAAPAAAPAAPPAAELSSEPEKDKSVAQPQPREAAAPEDKRQAASSVAAPAPAPELRKDAARLEADAAQDELKQEKSTAAPVAAPPAAPSAPQPARAAVAGQLSADAARSANAFAPVCVPGWSAAPADVASQLTAGAGPSAAVCWLVGRGGVVILSTDAGSTWRRVTFPEIADLLAVRATSARAASVTTADGRVFTTSDGGMTWIRP